MACKKCGKPTPDGVELCGYCKPKGQKADTEPSAPEFEQHKRQSK